jgi:hypothetical protein
MSRSSYKPRRGRRHNAKGRSTTGPRFVKLDHWFLKTLAWESLAPAQRALYVALAQRYNGYNNGEISMSVREAARLLHVAKDTATKAFRELEHKGFIKCNQCGSFNWKAGKATTWILTEHAFDDELPAKEFASWRPENSEHGPDPETRCPKIGTVGSNDHAIWLLGVLDLGPSPLFCTGPRSQSTAHI